MTDREKMYRRQLGGAEAALRRERQRVKALEDEAEKLATAVAFLRATIKTGAGKHVFIGQDALGIIDERLRELGIEVEE